MTDKKLKIAIISAHSCPVGDLGAKDTGGMSVYIRELARELGKEGHAIDIFTRVHDPADPRLEDLSEGVRLIHLTAGKEATIHKMDVYFSLPEFTFNLENFWKNNGLQYDIVFSHYWISALVGKYLYQTRQIPYINMYHTLGAVKNAIGIGERESNLRIVSERETVHDCQRIIVATEKEKQQLIDYYGAVPEKVGVVPCGVNMGLFKPIDKASARVKLGLADEKIVLFVGRIDPLKGIDKLIYSMSLLKNIDKVRLMVVGGDENSKPELVKLKKLADALNIGEHVDFRGLVTQEQLPYYYSSADICVVPSYYESFGLVPLESLACGTPVVATDVGDLKGIIKHGETGYILKDNSPGEIARAISRQLSLPVKDTESIMSIRASVSKWGWGNITEKIAGEMRLVLEIQSRAAV
ncbi:MAG: glycosyltransferase [Dehalococcoidales bacterium]|nr:glycosyltransferase [Dehalococcoidales bacterium]